MSNVLSTEKREQVVVLGRLGWPLRRIEQTTGVRRETASAYLRAAGIPIRPPGSWGRRPAKPANEVTTDPDGVNGVVEGFGGSDTSKPANEVTSDPEAENPVSRVVGSPSKPTVGQFLRAVPGDDSTGAGAWPQRDGDLAGPGHGSRFCRQLRIGQAFRSQTPGSAIPESGRNHPDRSWRGSAGRLRDRTDGPGSEDGQVPTDAAVRDDVGLQPQLTFKSSSRIWAQLHETAFRRLGGTRLIVLDNLREGVIVPDHYDPTLNPLFRDVLTHYGVVAMPCRVRDPDRKGKVESGVGHAQKTPLKGQRFESLDQAQGYLDRWEVRCRHPHPRHDQAAGGGHVRRRETIS